MGIRGDEGGCVAVCGEDYFGGDEGATGGKEGGCGFVGGCGG